MDVLWTSDNVEEYCRTLLGTELAPAADLFPRVVSATYIRMMNDDEGQNTAFDVEEFRAAVRRSLPASLPEVLPFFVRSVWNRKWNFANNAGDILSLAGEFVGLLNSNSGTSLSAQELVSECQSSFDHWQG
ncbi:MAG: hypothetical protein RL189_490 [Pseudomonadota bacterium]